MILLVAHHAFPRGVPPGTSRPQSMAKHLQRRGYEVTVLTSEAGGFPNLGLDGPEVIATRDLLASRLNWRRRPGPVDPGAGPGLSRGPGAISRLVPDVPAITWAPFALRRALRLADEREIDCLITTSPPHSVHAIGRALRRRGVPWVADLRDGWRFEPWHDWPTQPQRALDRRLERTTLSRADRVTAVSDPIVADLEHRLGIRAVTITNGFDPDLGAEGHAPTGLLDPARHSLVYTGTFHRGRGALRGLAEALRRLARESPEMADRLELAVAGPVTEAEWAELSRGTPAGLVRHLGAHDRAIALSLQREADSLLLLAEESSKATGKLFEYLAAIRPILVVGEHNAAARIVSETEAGIVAAADQPDQIAAAISDLAAGRVGFDPDRVAERSRPYSFERLAGRMAEVIEEAIRAASSR